MMRVVFMGTPEFAVDSLRAILEAGYDVPLVVTTPDRRKGRGLKSQESDVKQFAVAHELEVSTPESLKDPDVVELIRSKQPDVICVVAFRILPEAIYTIPPRGSFNLHASLLPKYRGAAPINWALINGETESGVTTFFLRRQVDTGGVILQRRVAIDPDMTAGDLHDALKVIGAQAVVETMRRIEAGDTDAVQQNDAEATPAPKIFRDDCRINWSLSAERVHNIVRGLSPYPGAFTRRGESALKVLRSRIAIVDADMANDPGMRPEDAAGAVGRIIVDGKRMLVECGSGFLELLQVQPEGRRVMSADEYLRGHLSDGRQRLE